MRRNVRSKTFPNSSKKLVTISNRHSIVMSLLFSQLVRKHQDCAYKKANSDIISEWFVEDLSSICGERHHAGIPVVDIEKCYKAARTFRSKYSLSLGDNVDAVDTISGMERCQIPYPSVAHAGRVQAWISKAFLNVAPRDLDVRSLVKSRWFGFVPPFLASI